MRKHMDDIEEAKIKLECLTKAIEVARGLGITRKEKPSIVGIAWDFYQFVFSEYPMGKHSGERE